MARKEDNQDEPAAETPPERAERGGWPAPDETPKDAGDGAEG